MWYYFNFRATIKALFQDKHAEREAELHKDTEAVAKIKKFDTFMSQQDNVKWIARNPNLGNVMAGNGRSFWKGIGVAFVLFLVSKKPIQLQFVHGLLFIMVLTVLRAMYGQ